MEIDELTEIVQRAIRNGAVSDNVDATLALSILTDRLKKAEISNMLWLSEDPEGVTWANQTTRTGDLISISWDAQYGCAKAFFNGDEVSSHDHRIDPALRERLIEMVREQQEIDRQEAATEDD